MAFVPYKLGTDLEFEKCLPPILVQEGGYSNDAHDPGGMTDYGIIQREYDAKRRAWGLPTQWVKNISADEYRTIYYTDYWLPDCPKLYAGLDLEVFNMNVNGGPHRSTVLLQEAIDVTADGAFGPVTEAAVKNLWGSEKVINTFKANADAFYKSLPAFKYFGKDWLRRDFEIGTQADTMDKALDAFAADKPPSIMKEG
jgi:lysozyme family protein